MTRMDSTALLKLGHLSCGHAGRPVRDGDVFKGKPTLREQDASKPRAGKGHDANVSDGGVFGEVNAMLELVRENPGLRANALTALSGKGRRTVERYLGALVLLKQVEFRGAPKNGGYYATSAKGCPHG